MRNFMSEFLNILKRVFTQLVHMHLRAELDFPWTPNLLYEVQMCVSAVHMEIIL
jgi:hypothetical protein